MIHLLGASGHGKVVAEIFQLRGEELVVLDADPRRVGTKILDIVVQDEESVLRGLRGSVDFFVAIGEGQLRRRAVERWRAAGHRLVRALHPAAVISPTAELAAGVCVMAGAVLQSSCRIGEGTIINTAATVDHDGNLGRYVHIAPGVHLAGDVSIRDEAWIGLGSVVREGITIGAGTLVGAGSVVVDEIPPQVVAYGHPCRVVHSRQKRPVV